MKIESAVFNLCKTSFTSLEYFMNEGQMSMKTCFLSKAIIAINTRKLTFSSTFPVDVSSKISK